MRQALKMSEDRFERFFEEAPLGIAILTDSGDLEDCNPALIKMLGYKESLEGRQLRRPQPHHKLRHFAVLFPRKCAAYRFAAMI